MGVTNGAQLHPDKDPTVQVPVAAVLSPKQVVSGQQG